MLRTRIIAIALSVLLVVSAGVLVIAAKASFSWGYVHDSPIMLYTGFLIKSGAVPYRDFFDMNMPGTYLVMWLVGTLFGWTDTAFRAFDLLCLTLLMLLTYRWMRPAGVLSACFASIAFALYYLLAGPRVSMQREYIALLPYSLMLVISCGNARLAPVAQSFLSGFLISAAFLIKPQFALLSLPAVVFLIDDAKRLQANIRNVVVSLIVGVVLPVGAVLIYLVLTDSLTPFLDMAINYWPLYASLTGGHEQIGGLERIIYIARSTLEGLYNFYLPMAILGITVLGRNQAMNKRTLLFVGLLVVSAIYPAMSGQFWGYHWIPFYYVAICAASLTIRPERAEMTSPTVFLSLVAAIFLLCTLCVANVEQVRWNLQAKQEAKEIPSKPDVADEVYQFLSTHLKQGDRVQPLDWTGGAVHGMLLARARLATRFIYDFHFYHDINTPYIQKLREDFIRELTQTKPRYIVQVLENKPWPSGPNTTHDFPQLQAYLDQNYATAREEETYKILERREELPDRQFESKR